MKTSEFGAKGCGELMVEGLAVGLSQSYTASASVLAVASSFLRQSKDMHIDRGLETFHDLEVHSESCLHYKTEAPPLCSRAAAWRFMC